MVRWTGERGTVLRQTCESLTFKKKKKSQNSSICSQMSWGHIGSIFVCHQPHLFTATVDTYVWLEEELNEIWCQIAFIYFLNLVLL